MTKNLKPAEALTLADAARRALRQLTALDFLEAARYRAWWNERDNREKFLKERTGQ
jgi:hypothetical protein